MTNDNTREFERAQNCRENLLDGPLTRAPHTIIDAWHD